MTDGAAPDAGVRAAVRAEVGRLLFGQCVTEAELGDEDDLFEAGLDSMAVLKLVAWIERRSGRPLPDGAVASARFRTIRAIVELAQEQGDGARTDRPR